MPVHLDVAHLLDLGRIQRDVIQANRQSGSNQRSARFLVATDNSRARARCSRAAHFTTSLPDQRLPMTSVVGGTGP